jgi:two-component system OmpR family sensor kinase
MGVLVEDLLLLARVDSTRPLERVTVDLRDIAQDAASDARAQAPDRTISVSAEEPVIVTADEDRLRQAVANLVTNALVHTPPDAPIELGLAKQPGGASITVTDWGPGLDEEMLAHAFDRFWRGDPSRARTSGGVGLGLAIVDAIARAHGGRVTVENRAGAGASFSIYIPIDAPEAESLTEGEASDANAKAEATPA